MSRKAGSKRNNPRPGYDDLGLSLERGVVMYCGKFEKAQTKKEFMNTIRAGGKGKQKFTQKKRSGMLRKVAQNSDTLKSGEK